MTTRRVLIALAALVAIPVLVGVAARFADAERAVTAKAVPVAQTVAAKPAAEPVVTSEPAVAQQPVLVAQNSAYDVAQSSSYDDDGSDDRSGDDGDSDDPALDDGRAHLRDANLTFEEARAIAQQAVPGASIDEIDLEHVNGKLVFEVDAGAKNVKIDAKSGKVISVSDRPFADND